MGQRQRRDRERLVVRLPVGDPASAPIQAWLNHLPDGQDAAPLVRIALAAWIDATEGATARRLAGLEARLTRIQEQLQTLAEQIAQRLQTGTMPVVHGAGQAAAPSALDDDTLADPAILARLLDFGAAFGGET